MFKLSTLAPIVLATLLAACGSQEAPAPKAEAPAPAAEPAAPPPAPVADATPPQPPAAEPASDAAMAGESIYKRTCALCHSAGVAGAPMLATLPIGVRASPRARTRSTSTRSKALPVQRHDAGQGWQRRPSLTTKSSPWSTTWCRKPAESAAPAAIEKEAWPPFLFAGAQRAVSGGGGACRRPGCAEDPA